MRTAIEILAEIYECTIDGEDLQMEITLNPAINILEKAINEARKEALQEAATKVNYPYRDEYGCHCDVPSIVLSLINELK